MKKIMHIREGSSLLMMLFLMTTLALCITALVRTAAFAHDAVRGRQVSEQRRMATQGLLQYGVAYATKNFAALSERNDTIQFSVADLAIGDGKIYEGLIEFTCNNATIMLRAQLILEGHTVCAVSCAVCASRDANNEQGSSYSISNWHHEGV